MSAPYLATMAQRYSEQVLSSSIGKRVVHLDFWNHGLKKNMPQHYKDYYAVWRQGPQQHVHSVPNTATFEKDEWGEIYPVQNPRVSVIYPDQFHEGLWGGEGVVKGMLTREDGNHRNFTPPAAKYWWPILFEGVLYSEILDAHIELVATKRGLRLVDEARGLDSYLLSTPVNEVFATKLLRLKRELLLRLADKENFSTRAGGRPETFAKFEQFALAQEEADWHGLTLTEAKQKQSLLERRQAEDTNVPDKLTFRRKMVEQLRSGEYEEDYEEEEGDSGGFLGRVFKR